MINAVIDISHWNSQVDFAEIKKAAVYGVVCKATQGINFIDPTYRKREPLILKQGLAHGAYHFGDGSDPILQAKFFIDTVQPAPDTLLALDWEALSMGIRQAEIFVQIVHTLTGRYPLLYGGWWMKFQTNRAKSTLLTNCDLWIAQYGSKRPVLPWKWKDKGYVFWQYGNLPRIKNCGRLDRNYYQGTLAELERFWSGGVVPNAV